MNNYVKGFHDTVLKGELTENLYESYKKDSLPTLGTPDLRSQIHLMRFSEKGPNDTGWLRSGDFRRRVL